jgi:ubiquinone/menaquinone biosynthesis C-methylase UbiE
MLTDTDQKTKSMKAASKYPGLQKQPGSDEHRGRLFQALRRFLRDQFGRPAGLWGDVMGRIMACTPSNMERTRWTISLLDIKPSDRLLEIGFGPGFAIKLASGIASEGFVAGVDHSEVMVRHASRRNAGALRDGKVELLLGSASKLPKFDEPFDKIFTINSIHFWPEPVDCLKELGKLLKPGGLIAVTLQPRSRSATDATTQEVGKEVAKNLALAGFSQVRLEIKKLKPVAAACAIGTKPV